MNPFSLVSLPHGALCVVALLCTGMVATATAKEPESQARLRTELMACRDGTSNQSRRDCEREAYSAHTEARRGGLISMPERYTANALRRCDAFKGDDRMDCEARLAPSARIDGSVGGGGVLREVTTPVR